MATVLVVDDHQPSRELVSAILTDAGHDVIEASDGLAAMALARLRQPAVILLDMELGFGGPDGWDVARELKHDPMTSVIQIVAVTALAMPGDMQSTLDAGCDSYLSKPFDCKCLREAVDKAVSVNTQEQRRMVNRCQEIAVDWATLP